MDVKKILPLIISIGLNENQKHHTVGTIPNSNIKIVEKLKLKFCWNLINSVIEKKSKLSYTKLGSKMPSSYINKLLHNTISFLYFP